MKRSGKRWILLIAAIAVAAVQAVGLFLLMRTKPATSLVLSETALVLKRDEGRRITHTIEPEAASAKLLKYKVSASDEIIAWVDEQNEMILGVSPGTCQIAAEVDGLRAVIDVTVTDETILAGTFQTETGDVRLSLDQGLSGMLETPDGTARLTLFYGVIADGENTNPYRWIKLTGDLKGTPLTVWYDRLTDTLRLHTDGAPDRILVRN